MQMSFLRAFYGFHFFAVSAVTVFCLLLLLLLLMFTRKQIEGNCRNHGQCTVWVLHRDCTIHQCSKQCPVEINLSFPRPYDMILRNSLSPMSLEELIRSAAYSSQSQPTRWWPSAWGNCWATFTSNQVSTIEEYTLLTAIHWFTYRKDSRRS